MVAFCNIFFFSFQYKNCPVFVLWAMLRKYVIGNKSPILRGLLPRLIVPNGNKWNSCPLLMICCQPISSMVIAHSKEKWFCSQKHYCLAILHSYQRNQAWYSTQPDFQGKSFTPQKCVICDIFSQINSVKIRIKCILYFHLYFKLRCFCRNLYRWHKFYTAAGSDGIDKFHLCIMQIHMQSGFITITVTVNIYIQ